MMKDKLLFALCMVILFWSGMKCVDIIRQTQLTDRNISDLQKNYEQNKKFSMYLQSYQSRESKFLNSAYDQLLIGVDLLKRYYDIDIELVIENYMNQDLVENYHEATEFNLIYRLPIQINAGQFSDNIQIALFLENFAEISERLPMEIQLIKQDINHILIKGFVYGVKGV